SFFSLRDIQSMLISLLGNGDVDETLLSEHIWLIRDPIYSPYYIKRKELIRTAGNWIRAYIMIKTHAYKYILFDNGDEMLFMLPNESTDLASDPNYREIKHDMMRFIPSTLKFLPEEGE